MKEIRVTISRTGADRYSVRCVPDSLRFDQGETVRWRVEGIPAGFQVGIQLPPHTTPAMPLRGRPSPPNDWCEIETTVRGPRPPAPPKPPETYTGDYRVFLESTSPARDEKSSLVVSYETGSSLVIDKSGPPPDDHHGHGPGHGPGEGPRPGRGGGS